MCENLECKCENCTCGPECDCTIDNPCKEECQ